MCFSEEISWATLATGTVINIITLVYLFNIKNPKVITPIVLILLWQYALLMQIPDALFWANPNAKYPGKIAFFLNTTQPLICVMFVGVALFRLGISPLRLIPAILSALIYSVFIIKEAFKIKDFNITSKKNCRNLDYIWWKPILLILYALTIILAIATLPWPYAILTIALFILSFIITKIISGKSCDSSSLWCWSVVFCGFITFLFYILQPRAS